MSHPLAHSIHSINCLEQDAFVALLGPVFEDTPKIAIATWPQRPFASKTDLYEAMLGVMRSLSEPEQLALICAHPDLGTQTKMAEASVEEQSSVGLDQLNKKDFEIFSQLNQAYKEKFDFPFIIAVKHHTRDSILNAFKQRLNNSYATEKSTALDQIATIARLRLDALIDDGWIDEALIDGGLLSPPD